MAIDRRYRWALGIGTGALVAAGGGMLIGDQAVADMAPFYANLAMPDSERVADEPISQPDDEWDRNSGVEAVNVSYSRAVSSASDDSARSER